MTCSATIEIGQKNKKRLRERRKSDRIKLPHQFTERRSSISHEQYNTKYEVSSIPNEIFGKIRSKQGKQKIQQITVIHIFLEKQMGWKCGVP